MTAHPFLTDAWIAAARVVHQELTGAVEGEEVTEVVDARINVVVTSVPFGEGRLHGHLDAAAGTLEIELGHLDTPHATITLDYETARSLVVERDTQAVTKAFLAGTLVVEGDLARLLALVARPAPPSAADAAERIRAMTL